MSTNSYLQGVWQQVLKREQVSNPLLTRSYFGNQVTERTKFSPAKQQGNSEQNHSWYKFFFQEPLATFLFLREKFTKFAYSSQQLLNPNTFKLSEFLKSNSKQHLHMCTLLLQPTDLISKIVICPQFLLLIKYFVVMSLNKNCFKQLSKLGDICLFSYKSFSQAYGTQGTKCQLSGDRSCWASKIS